MLFQFLIHVVPILLVLLQKTLKLRLILHHKPGHTGIDKFSAQLVQPVSSRIDGHLQPLQFFHLISPSRCRTEQPFRDQHGHQ